MKHHARAAAANAAVATEAAGVLRDVLSGESEYRRLLLKAAAGAGKSYVLRQLVAAAVEHPSCDRVAVVAFTNKQTWPLAVELGKLLGQDRVCLFPSGAMAGAVPQEVWDHASVASSTVTIPATAKVIVSTVHKLGAIGELRRQSTRFGAGKNGELPFDVLFCDEAWQVAHHLFDKVAKAAPVWVGVGDVGQLPPLEVGDNPWRGDSGYNPYRAWPTGYDAHAETWAQELPAVWRPTAEQLPLWRSFYPEWAELSCVAAPGDRKVSFTGTLAAPVSDLWAAVATGRPVLAEVDGLPEPDAPDVDEPLMRFVEYALAAAFDAGIELQAARYDGTGVLTGEIETRSAGLPGDPLIAVLATRNQAVDDAAAAVGRLAEAHGLTGTDLTSSTVDSWQGQTNGITVGVHPLTGATKLDEFNSAFGRLAVVATRATHGLLLVTRPGLDGLLRDTPARPGTPLGEPGNRRLPRQTHAAILGAFDRVTVTAPPNLLADPTEKD